MVSASVFEYIVILGFIALSYLIAVRSIFKNQYKPNLYSRIIWFFLALNSFASVVALKNSPLVIAYGFLGLVGNFTILALSWKKSPRLFGTSEFISTILLSISLLIWIFTNLPFLNLTIGLIAHFIGGLPTIRRAIINPRSENVHFWLYFCIASILTVSVTNRSQLSDYLYPLYFALFDGLMIVLCMRRFTIHKLKHRLNI